MGYQDSSVVRALWDRGITQWVEHYETGIAPWLEHYGIVG